MKVLVLLNSIIKHLNKKKEVLCQRKTYPLSRMQDINELQSASKKYKEYFFVRDIEENKNN